MDTSPSPIPDFDMVFDPETLKDNDEIRSEIESNIATMEADREAQSHLAKEIELALKLLDGTTGSNGTATIAQMRVIVSKLIKHLIKKGVIG